MQNLNAITSANANILYPVPPVQFSARETYAPQTDYARNDNAQTDIEAKVNIVFARLPQASEVPFVKISHIAPLLGLTDSGLRKHCLNCSQLKNWRGDYRFHLDDAQHVKALRALLKLVLWSGRKLPSALQVSYAPTMPMPVAPVPTSKYLH